METIHIEVYEVMTLLDELYNSIENETISKFEVLNEIHNLHCKLFNTI